MKEPCFTILTACCNGSQYIEDWTRSIIEQTYRPLSVVVIDDLSSDDSIKLLKKKQKIFAKHNVNLKIITHTKKLYYGGCLRYAFLSSVSPFLGILDIDDYLVSDAVEHVMKLYVSHKKIGYIYTQFMVCDSDLTPKKRGFCVAPPKKSSILSMGMQNTHIYSHFRTFSTRIKNAAEIFPKRGKYAVDQYMGLSLERLGYGLFTDKVCYYYRAGGNESISAKFGSQRRRYWYKLLDYFASRKKRTYRIKQYDGK